MKRAILKHALQIARKGLSRHPEMGRYLHYSFVYANGKLVEWATNRRGVPPIHMGYHDRRDSPTFRPKTHSELAAWIRARGLLEKGEPWVMINIRLSKNGELRCSKPCEICESLMKALGCEKVYYSNSTNDFERLVNYG